MKPLTLLIFKALLLCLLGSPPRVVRVSSLEALLGGLLLLLVLPLLPGLQLLDGLFGHWCCSSRLCVLSIQPLRLASICSASSRPPSSSLKMFIWLHTLHSFSSQTSSARYTFSLRRRSSLVISSKSGPTALSRRSSVMPKGSPCWTFQVKSPSSSPSSTSCRCMNASTSTPSGMATYRS